jgi:hypothetical protein
MAFLLWSQFAQAHPVGRIGADRTSSHPLGIALSKLMTTE